MDGPLGVNWPRGRVGCPVGLADVAGPGWARRKTEGQTIALASLSGSAGPDRTMDGPLGVNWPWGRVGCPLGGPGADNG